jgi:hypothetical protein
VDGVSNVGGVGSVGLKCERDDHRFSARLETAGIAASRGQGWVDRRDGTGEELSTREGARGR